MSQAQLEREGGRLFAQLTSAWRITGNGRLLPISLQAEMERMAQHTQQPEILRELFDALGNDPFVIAECLARPALADRLLSDRSAIGRRIEGAPAQRAEAELLARATVTAPEDEPLESWATRADNELPTTMATSSGEYTLPNISHIAACIDNSWTAASTTNAPAGRLDHTAVWTGNEMIVWGGYSGNQSFHNGARYNPD